MVPDVSTLKERYEEIRNNVINAANISNRDPQSIKIIAVSKTHPVEYILNGIEAGMNIFGENYAQEIKEKFEYFENNNLTHPEWHFIGHLQRNKVKYIMPFVSMIHGVDSVRLANQINNEAEKIGRKVDVLLQVNTSGEASKFGCDPDSLINIAAEALKLKNICIKGLMTIGSFTFDGVANKREFGLLRTLLDDVNKKFDLELKELSMGMTNDYELAVQEGATMVRVGTAIFGERDYSNS